MIDDPTLRLPTSRPVRRGLQSLAFLLVLVLVILGAPAAAEESSAFDRILASYEPIRLALVQDTVDGIEAPARDILVAIESLSSDYGAENAGVDAEHAATVEDLLGDLAVAAEALVAAGDLTSARDAFYDLSKPLVRYRAAIVASGRAEGSLPVVAFCSMARRSWLQPAGTIGNPYHGQTMAECGEIVGA